MPRPDSWLVAAGSGHAYIRQLANYRVFISYGPILQLDRRVITITGKSNHYRTIIQITVWIGLQHLPV